MPIESAADRKRKYHEKVTQMFDEYQQILVVGIDNIGSDHMQRIRKAIRGLATLVCGKNTLVRRSIRLLTKTNPQLEALTPYVKGNVALVFTKQSLSSVRDKLLELKVEAPAKPGATAPNDVVVPKGPTGLEPTKTTFLQALNIGSKINRGQIEIINDKLLIEAGQKVGPSEATLLQMLNIKPFSYGLSVQTIYDHGSVYEPAILDIKEEDILKQFQTGIQRIACLGLAISYPNIASLPHSLSNGFKRILSIALATDYSFPQADLFKQIAANPQAFAGPAATTTATAPPPTETKAAEAPKVEEKPVEKDEDEEDEDMGGGGLFGGGDDDW